MGTHTNKDFLFKMAKELKCGSKGCWIAAFVVCLVLGIVLAAIAVAMGGCEHAGKCIYETGSLGSSQSFEGCEKGDYDSVKCFLSPNCQNKHCKFGGLDLGLMWAMLIIGIVLIVLAGVFSCGICACGCFGKAGAPPTEIKGAAPTAEEIKA